MKNEMSFIESTKPDDWPQNRRELILSLINDFCDDFIKNPTYINKERLIALTTFDDPNSNYNFGIYRFTDYEAGLINCLYLKFKKLCFQYGINFLYDLLWNSAYHIKMINMVSNATGYGPDNYCFGLHPCLCYFYLTAYCYFVEKKRNLACELINEIDNLEKANVMTQEDLAVTFNNVIYDLSGKCTNHCFKQFEFSRDDIKKLFLKSSELMNKAHFNQTHNPHKGILCMTLSNFVLRSRNDYRFDNIYKCVNKPTVDASFVNSELWMRKRSKLNDKREGKAVREIFSNRKWIKYDWAKSMKFTYERESFTCSFSKNVPDERMRKRYGNFVYGFHNDVVGPSITTLIKDKNGEIRFSQFIVYDVLYSREEFKNEMNYLFSIIDDFYLSDADKRLFLEEIIDYWKLTIKDKKWSKEQERRYEIMYFSGYDYAECSITEEFLKNKTPLLLYPDFIFGENYQKDRLLFNIEEKTKFQSLGETALICKKCLFRAHHFSKDNRCPICGSDNYEVIKTMDKSN